MLRFLWLCFFLGLGNSTWIVTPPAPTYQANWESLDSRPLPDWYDKAKFGILLHWGAYSVPSYGREWFWYYWQQSQRKYYVEFMRRTYRPGFAYPQFGNLLTAEFFDPTAWAVLLKDSGAKYVVFMSKHHEGFALWPSSYSWNWNAKDLGPQRDLLGDLAIQVRYWTDLKFGVGYSLLEWFHPMYLSDRRNGFQTNEFVETKIMPEMEELVNKYKPHILWNVGDFQASDTYWNSTNFLAWLYNKSPVKDTVVVNDHWGMNTQCKHGGYFSCVNTYNPVKYKDHKWESTIKLDKSSWGYRRNAKFTDYLTPEELIWTLVETVSCGGNLMLNVAPTSDGRIITIFEERLRQIGSWLKLNGPAIYGSKPWNYAADITTPGVRYTKNVDTKSLYIIMSRWPKDNKLYLGSLQITAGATISMLGVTKTFTYSGFGAGTVITFPELRADEKPCEYAWVLKTNLPCSGTCSI